MFQQGSELSVILGEGVGLLARGRAGFHWWLHAKGPQQISELVVGHEEFLGPLLPAQFGQQFLLAFMDRSEVGVQHHGVQHQLRLGVHADGLVDDQQFLLGEALRHRLEQFVGQVHIHHAVLSVGL